MITVTANPGFYICPVCRHVFKKGNLECGVIHPPETCCHYGDREVFLNETPPVSDAGGVPKGG